MRLSSLLFMKPHDFSGDNEDDQKHHTRLYLIGIEHLIDRFILTPDDIVRVIEPDVVLLEARTYDSIYLNSPYSNNSAISNAFDEEIKNPENYLTSPSLLEIKSSVDDIGILVRGFDCSRSIEKRLQKDNNIDNDCWQDFYDSILSRLDDIDDSRLADDEYRMKENLKDRLSSYNLSVGDSVNSFSTNYHAIKDIISEVGEISHMFRDELILFDRLGKNLNDYMMARENIMFRNISEAMKIYSRIVCFMGYSHLSEDSHLVERLSESGMNYAIFINVDR